MDWDGSGIGVFCVYTLYIIAVIQWLNKQITETQLTQQRVGTFENPAATTNFRPSNSALVSQVLD